MSQVQTTTYDCAYCDDEYQTPGFQGSFCSPHCFYAKKGDDALNLLRHNHTVCPTCGNELKSVEPPSDDWKHRKGSALDVALQNGGTLTKDHGQQVLDLTEVSGSRPVPVESVCGFQYRTEHACTVEQTHEIDDYTEVVTTGTGCECGTTDLFTIDNDIQEIALTETLANYVRRFRAFWEEGQLDQRLDKRKFFEAYKDSRDIRYAVGVGLHG